MASSREAQLSFFPEHERWRRVGPATVDDATRQLAERLPGGVYLGTSSWSFPGWSGIVYDREATTNLLARHGLAAYAQHPLLRAVGIDRSYYAPLAEEAYRAYAEVVPEGFRFLAKGQDVCTLERFPSHPRFGARAGEPNPHYLDPAYASDQVVAPFAAGLGRRAGVLVFQFTPQRTSEAEPIGALAVRLHRFLEALPKGVLYAVEIRHEPWLSDAYAEALDAAGAAPCLTVHPSMPGLAEQAARFPRAPALVARWNLGGRRRYEQAKERYAPFDRIVDPDVSSRGALAGLVASATASGRPSFITINNKAEGSAPLSVRQLAAAIGEAATPPAAGEEAP
ncbi:MAG: DUF72 domain-containing protein [Myxococcota bacterium]